MNKIIPKWDMIIQCLASINVPLAFSAKGREKTHSVCFYTAAHQFTVHRPGLRLRRSSHLLIYDFTLASKSGTSMVDVFQTSSQSIRS